MAIEIVDCPIKNGDFPWQNVSSPEGISRLFPMFPNFLDVSAASQDRAKMLKACAEGSHSSHRAWQ